MRISDWSSDVCSSDLGQLEVAVVQRLGQDFLGQQQRDEQLGAPLQVGERREHVSRDHGTDRALEHGDAVQLDARGVGDRGDLLRRLRTPGLLEIDREHVEIGSSSCWDRGKQYAELSMVAESLTK